MKSLVFIIVLGALNVIGLTACAPAPLPTNSDISIDGYRTSFDDLRNAVDEYQSLVIENQELKRKLAEYESH